MLPAFFLRVTFIARPEGPFAFEKPFLGLF
jgi:hypothetical protein